MLAVHKVPLSEAGDDEPSTEESLQVPEVVRSDLIGEWLIPNGEALLISLGAHTVAAADGRAEVRERLVVLEAHPADLAVTKAALVPMMDRMTTSLGIARTPVRLNDDAVPMPAPAPPSRSLPQPMHADGSPAPLPPLPPDVDTPTSMPDSSEPCAARRPGKCPRPGRPTPIRRRRVSIRRRARGSARSILTWHFRRRGTLRMTSSTSHPPPSSPGPIRRRPRNGLQIRARPHPVGPRSSRTRSGSPSTARRSRSASPPATGVLKPARPRNRRAVAAKDARSARPSNPGSGRSFAIGPSFGLRFPVLQEEML